MITRPAGQAVKDAHTSLPLTPGNGEAWSAIPRTLCLHKSPMDSSLASLVGRAGLKPVFAAMPRMLLSGWPAKGTL